MILKLYKTKALTLLQTMATVLGKNLGKNMLQGSTDAMSHACKRKRHSPAGMVPCNRFDAKLSLLMAALSCSLVNMTSATPVGIAVLAGMVPDNRFPVRSIDWSFGASNQSKGMLPETHPGNLINYLHQQ